MKINLLRILLISFILCLISCEKTELSKDNIISKDKKSDDKSISQNAIEKLGVLFGSKNIISSSQDAITRADSIDDISFRPKEIESITPIELADTGRLIKIEKVPELYVINYKDDNGYVIVNMSEDKYPIVSFNNKGNFYYNELDSVQMGNLQEQFTDYVIANDGERLNVWGDIIDCMNNPELNEDGIPTNSTDSTCVTTIEFQPVENIEDINKVEAPDDKIIIFEDIPHDDIITRAIPERTYPKFRASVYPMVGRWGLRWHMSNPYNIEMPVSMAFGEKFAVPAISVALSKIMYCHRYPWFYDWGNMPQQVALGQKSSVSSLLKEITEMIGAVESTHSYDFQCNNIMNIPKILQSKFFYFNGGTVIQYQNDEIPFDFVYSTLAHYGSPVLFCSMWRSGNLNSNQNIKSAWIVDGYQELRIKVVKKWYFCNICYKKRTYIYYRDYFHYVLSMNAYSKQKGQYYDDSCDGWFRYDHYTSKIGIKNYALVLFRP